MSMLCIAEYVQQIHICPKKHSYMMYYTYYLSLLIIKNIPASVHAIIYFNYSLLFAKSLYRVVAAMCNIRDTIIILSMKSSAGVVQ